MSQALSSPPRCFMTNKDLCFVTHGEAQMRRFSTQPTTELIAMRRSTASYVIQLIGGSYHVYDLRTCRKILGTYTIGLPVFVTYDFEPALAYAVLVPLD